MHYPLAMRPPALMDQRVRREPRGAGSGTVQRDKTKGRGGQRVGSWGREGAWVGTQRRGSRGVTALLASAAGPT